MKYSVVSLCIVAVALSACGGGGGTAATPTPIVNQSVGGIWKGNFTTASGVAVTGVALVAENGQFYSFAENLNNSCADVSKGTMSASGSMLSGSAQFGIVNFTTSTGIATNCTYPDGSTSGTGTVSGTIAQRSSLTLTASATTANGTALPGNTVTLAYDNLYSKPSSLSAISGNWIGPTGVVLNITSSGVIFAQDPASGCVVNGQVSIINSSYNAYSASVTYSSCQGSAAVLNGVNATGLQTIDDTVTPNLLYTGYSATVNGVTIIVVSTATR